MRLKLEAYIFSKIVNLATVREICFLNIQSPFIFFHRKENLEELFIM